MLQRNTRSGTPRDPLGGRHVVRATPQQRWLELALCSLPHALSFKRHMLIYFTSSSLMHLCRFHHSEAEVFCIGDIHVAMSKIMPHFQLLKRKLLYITYFCMKPKFTFCFILNFIFPTCPWIFQENLRKLHPLVKTALKILFTERKYLWHTTYCIAFYKKKIYMSI